MIDRPDNYFTGCVGVELYRVRRRTGPRWHVRIFSVNPETGKRGGGDAPGYLPRQYWTRSRARYAAEMWAAGMGRLIVERVNWE